MTVGRFREPSSWKAINNVCPGEHVFKSTDRITIHMNQNQSWSWWPSGLIKAPTVWCDLWPYIYWGCGFEFHWGHDWTAYPCKAINQLYSCQN